MPQSGKMLQKFTFFLDCSTSAQASPGHHHHHLDVFLDQKAQTPQNVYVTSLFDQKPFTPKPLTPKNFLHQTQFTQLLHQRYFTPHAFYTTSPLHKIAFDYTRSLFTPEALLRQKQKPFAPEALACKPHGVRTKSDTLECNTQSGPKHGMQNAIVTKRH